MSGMKFALLSVLAALAMAGVFSVMAEDADAAGVTVIEGYVGEIGDVATTPAANVHVHIHSGTNNYDGYTNSAGKFSIPVSETDASTLSITITKDGCGVFNVPAPLSKLPTGDSYSINLGKCGVSGTKYAICEDLDHSIIISNANVQISITVTGSESRLLKGALVTLYQDGVKKYSGETDDTGICKTSAKLPIGEYTVELKCDGYADASENITVSKVMPSHVLTMQEKEIPTYAGITTYHILMVSGIVVGIVLAIIAYMLCRRNWAGVEGE